MKQKLKNLINIGSIYLNQKFYHLVYYFFWQLMIIGAINVKDYEVAAVFLLAMIVVTPYIYSGLSPTLFATQKTYKECIKIAWFNRQNYFILVLSILILSSIWLIMNVFIVGFKAMVDFNFYISFGLIIIIIFYFMNFSLNKKRLKSMIKGIAIFTIVILTIYYLNQMGYSFISLIAIVSYILFKIIKFLLGFRR